MYQEVQSILINQSIDERLRQIANILLLNASFIDNLGLLNGKMGIAIFFYHYSHYTKNKVFEDYAGELIDEIYEEINTKTPVNFADGLTGIGWGIEYLVKNGFVQAETDEALIEIDTCIYHNSLYRPFLLESGNDLFGYGLYFLIRLGEHGTNDDNLRTLLKMQHLIYLTDDCERILIKKKYLDFNIQSLSIDAINSFAWFLIEMHRWGMLPYKIGKLFQALPEYFGIIFQNSNDHAGIVQLNTLIRYMIPCFIDADLRNSYETIYNQSINRESYNETFDEILVSHFVKTTWQDLLYDPYIPSNDNKSFRAVKAFQVIDNEEYWNKRLDDLKKNNIGLTGLAGLGLGFLIYLMKEELKKTNSEIKSEIFKAQFGN